MYNFYPSVCMHAHQGLRYFDLQVCLPSSTLALQGYQYSWFSVCLSVQFVCVLATIFFCHHMQQDNKIYYSNAIGSLLHWLYDVKTKLTSPQWWSIESTLYIASMMPLDGKIPRPEFLVFLYRLYSGSVV